MDIKTWFDIDGSYADGLTLYGKLQKCNPTLLKSLARENSTNFLKLKYELKSALLAGNDISVPKKEETPAAPPKRANPEPLLREIIQQSAAFSFQKENMAMYPRELHSVYRQRVNDFYHACELKFQLNAIPERDEDAALKIILQLEDLWTRIDRAWMILDHWKDHSRIMPTEESEDFSKLNGVQLVMMRDRLETRISKRKATIVKMQADAVTSPEDRSLANLLNRKLEQLHQLELDLATIKNLLKNEQPLTRSA